MKHMSLKTKYEVHVRSRYRGNKESIIHRLIRVTELESDVHHAEMVLSSRVIADDRHLRHPSCC